MAVRKLPNGKYEIRYPSHRNPKGRISYRFKVVGYSKRKAKELEQKLYSDFKEREVRGIPHPLERETRREYSVSELLDWYIGLDKVKALKSYSDVVGRTRPLNEFYKDRRAGELLPSDVESYQTWRKKQKVRKYGKKEEIVCKHNVSNATVNREIACLKSCYNLAIREGLLERNPCVGVKRLKEQERNRICSREEFEALKCTLHGDARDIVVIAYHTGMRRGEIHSLTWNRVDLKRQLIFLRGQDTKNGEPRKVPFLSKEVNETFEHRGGNPRRIHGKVFHIGSVRKAFETACKRLDIKDLRFHDLRHSAATNMRKAGVDAATIMKICGWKDVSVFLRYNEVDDSDIEKASVAIAQVEENSEEKRLTRDAVIVRDR
jgi:integrase